MATNSVTLHRVLKATPEKVYRAFTEANALSFWLPPYGYLGVVYQLDARTGGSYKMSFINFSTGNGHSFGGNFLEIKPNEFIKHTDRFDNPDLPGEMSSLCLAEEGFLRHRYLKLFRRVFLLLCRQRCAI